MSRSNGPGAPPNGWPADYRPNEAVDPYQDPYYAQQPARQQPSHPQQAATPARGARIQQPAPSRVPQNGLPPNLSQGGHPGQPQGQGYAQPYASQSPQQPTQPGYGHSYGQQPTHTQAAPQQYSPPQQYAPQPAAQAYAPAPQPQAYTPQPTPRTQPPSRSAPPAQSYQTEPQGQHADPRFAAYPPGYDAPPTGRPTQPASPVYPPVYTPAPAPLAYVPETTQRPALSSQQRAPQPQQQVPSSYDKWQIPPQGQPSHGHPAQPQIDPHGYDLGNYLPSAGTEQRAQRPTAPPAAWPQHAEPEPRQQSPGSSFPSQLPAGLPASAQALEKVHDDEYDEHEDDDYEEAPRKTRYGLIAASLIAAIAMGGGLAYAYKMYVAPRAQLAAAPVVKNSSGPVKVKPVDPGGTKFANADSKMMEQLAGSSDTNADGGPKAVRTMTIERDGSVQTGSVQNASPPSPPAIQPASPAALPRAASVPGMMIEGLSPTPRPQAPQPAAIAAVVNPTVPAQQPPRAAPKIIAAAPPPAAYPNEAPAALGAATPPVALVKKVPPKKVAAAAGAAAAPSAVGGPAKGANGFVAVLASVPASGSSRNDAMQQFADLQQKFGGVLGSKSPDVVEAKLPNGVYHRLVVGPPASRDSATGVCTQLKASGYTADCWVTAF